ncbi:response regulator [Comamonas odontotermitis]|uniref:response regulator n=1 Tax=Comamonas odontotermitis TaxID=379895 RepID=UPI00366DCC1B
MPLSSPHAGVVLVVDDAIETLGFLCEALSQKAYTVLVARNANEAIERFEIAMPDAVLLDCIMPGEDGFALCRKIKACPEWSHVSVIFMTGLSETDHIVEGFASGGVDYVVKPIKLPEVLARLARHMHNANVRRLAQAAVDVAGMGTAVLDRQGRIAWHSPQASRWLELAFGGKDSIASIWLQSAHTNGESRIEFGNSSLFARYVGSVGIGESMLVLHLENANATADANSRAQRLHDAALTPRETEVLGWLAKGKTNRDIAQILGMSPRTVNKHLEHIFEKLGVETRAAAAAIASGS